ncbi:hypothetical protein AALP_AA6G153300 [Arabis alpina]|uniref:Uncharacterized protein n=1 Tax=Arabis alpina TaxID=50452 RepID=A0A087GPE2_ARAAL|nr:hypothetical protein AALP_AA6G153300 [Arabis alpina]
MRGATPGMPAFNTPSIPIRSRKSRRLSKVSNRTDAEVTADLFAIVIIQDSEDNTEGTSLPSQEENLAVRDGSQKIPSMTDAADAQRADDTLARGSVPGESNELKGPADASRSKGKGKVDPIDKNAEKKRIAAKAKADLEEMDRQRTQANTWEICAAANRQSEDDYAAQVEVLKEEKQKLEEEVKKRDAHLEAAFAEMAKLRATLEKSHLTKDRLGKERDEARRRADEIASGNSAQRARHSSRLERIRLYLITLHALEEVKAQLCYRRGARISLEKMVEAEYELPPGLLENYAKEEEKYLAQVESFSADSVGDDTLFPTPLSPPVGPPRDVAS